MAFVVADRVKEVTLTSGTGPVTPSGASAGYVTFAAAIGTGNTTFYTIADNTTGDWEVGAGTFNGTQLVRDTVFSSSNGGALVDFEPNPKDIFCTLPAERAVYNNVDGSLVYDPAGSAIIYSIALG